MYFAIADAVTIDNGCLKSSVHGTATGTAMVPTGVVTNTLTCASNKKYFISQILCKNRAFSSRRLNKKYPIFKSKSTVLVLELTASARENADLKIFYF